jgi:hypothetical protein
MIQETRPPHLPDNGRQSILPLFLEHHMWRTSIASTPQTNNCTACHFANVRTEDASHVYMTTPGGAARRAVIPGTRIFRSR